MTRLTLLCAVMASTASLAACGPGAEAPPAEAPAPVTQPAALETDAWIGDWIGVEGNSLKIAASAAPGEYKISERTLDGPLAYNGRGMGATIVFQDKDMQTRTIRPGTGDETGLKYLAGKTNCLWIETGRGFCRD